jgi:hypothetical protein
MDRHQILEAQKSEVWGCFVLDVRMILPGENMGSLQHHPTMLVSSALGVGLLARSKIQDGT